MIPSRAIYRTQVEGVPAALRSRTGRCPRRRRAPARGARRRPRRAAPRAPRGAPSRSRSRRPRGRPGPGARAPASRSAISPSGAIQKMFVLLPMIAEPVAGAHDPHDLLGRLLGDVDLARPVPCIADSPRPRKNIENEVSSASTIETASGAGGELKPACTGSSASSGVPAYSPDPSPLRPPSTTSPAPRFPTAPRSASASASGSAAAGTSSRTITSSCASSCAGAARSAGSVSSTWTPAPRSSPTSAPAVAGSSLIQRTRGDCATFTSPCTAGGCRASAAPRSGSCRRGPPPAGTRPRRCRRPRS